MQSPVPPARQQPLPKTIAPGAGGGKQGAQCRRRVLCRVAPSPARGWVYLWYLCKNRFWWGGPGEGCAPQGLPLPTCTARAAVPAPRGGAEQGNLPRKAAAQSSHRLFGAFIHLSCLRDTTSSEKEKRVHSEALGRAMMSDPAPKCRLSGEGSPSDVRREARGRDGQPPASANHRGEGCADSKLCPWGDSRPPPGSSPPCPVLPGLRRPLLHPPWSKAGGLCSPVVHADPCTGSCQKQRCL